MMKIDIFFGSLDDGLYKIPLENGRTTFHLPRTECVDTIVKNCMTIISTVMITITEYYSIKPAMKTNSNRKFSKKSL